MKETIKYLIPRDVLNAVLLHFPVLYDTKLVNYESNVDAESVRNELLAQLATTLHVPGDIIECGSSRCGTSVIMALFMRSRNAGKTVFACDSFEGFDRDELRREYAAGLTSTPADAFTSTSFDYVKRKIAVLGLQDAIVPVKGYFEETLPNLHGPFSFALIDCDLKESMTYAAETVWPRLSPDGLMLFDDYGHDEFKGAKLGIDEFVGHHRDEMSSQGLLSHFYYAHRHAAAPSG